MANCKEVLTRRLLQCVLVCSVLLIPGKLLAQRGFYTPKSLVIPLHDQKNGLHLSVGRGGGYDLNLSYAFTDKLAVFSSATFDNDTKKRRTILGDRYNVDRSDYVLKGGLGYFVKVNNPVFPIIEAYAGAGVSKIDNFWHFKGDADGEITQADYWSLFGQLNAGNKFMKGAYALGLRFAYSQFTHFGFQSTHPNTSYIKSNYINLKGLTADPVLSYSYIVNGFHINAQVGLSVPLVAHSAARTDTHTTYEGTTAIRTIVRTEEEVFLAAALGRLSIQYNLNFSKQDKSN